MSAALAPNLNRISKTILAFIGFEITDETFAVSVSNYQHKPVPLEYQLSLNITSHFTWITSTVLGSVVGNSIGNPNMLGLNYALPAMFIGLLFLHLKTKISIIVAFISFFISLIIFLLLPGNWNIIIATIIAATIGVIIEHE